MRLRTRLVALSSCALAACGSTDRRPPEPEPEPNPDVIAPTPKTHELVELVNHIAGCRAGQRGQAEFRRGDEVLALLRPGEKKSLLLPHGDVTLTITEGGKTETRSYSLDGTGPLLVAIGCGPETFAGGLQPLVLEGARASCENAGTVRVRAGGLELEVGTDQYQTLFLPRGSHVVKVGGVDRTIELGLGGLLVPLVTCGTASP